MKNLEVLIPVYNDSQGLTQTINSIDDENLSITIIDDGSTDSIGLSSFKNYKSNINLIHLKVNSGIIVALNKGLDSLSNNPPKYIFRIDAGDIFSSTGIKERLDLIENENVGIIGGTTEFIDQKTNRIFVSDRFSKRPSRLFPLVTNYVHSGVIFKYSSLRYNKLNKYCEDVFLFKEIEDKFGGRRIKTKYRVKVFQGITGISTGKRDIQISSFINSIRRNSKFLDKKVMTLALIKLFLLKIFLKRKSNEMFIKSMLGK